MKGTLTQYVTLGVMLLLLIFLVSMLPEQKSPKLSGQLDTKLTVSKLSNPDHIKQIRSN
jgi:hypothetical protein